MSNLDFASELATAGVTSTTTEVAESKPRRQKKGAQEASEQTVTPPVQSEGTNAPASVNLPTVFTGLVRYNPRFQLREDGVYVAYITIQTNEMREGVDPFASGSDLYISYEVAVFANSPTMLLDKNKQPWTLRHPVTGAECDPVQAISQIAAAGQRVQTRVRWLAPQPAHFVRKLTGEVVDTVNNLGLVEALQTLGSERAIDPSRENALQARAGTSVSALRDYLGL